jgi:hypothetical protein
MSSDFLDTTFLLSKLAFTFDLPFSSGATGAKCLVLLLGSWLWKGEGSLHRASFGPAAVHKSAGVTEVTG